MSKRILIAEDDGNIRELLRIYLEQEGYKVDVTCNGGEALAQFKRERPDLVILDIMMPVLDGIGAMVKIREISNIPVILLTAKSEDTDKILGLNVGADDYITKPFNPVEVMARVKSQLRRYMMLGGGKTNEQSIVIGTLELDDTAKKVTVDGEKVSLTPKEYEILHFLMQNAGKVFSPKEIYLKVWKDNPYGAESTVAVHIRHLREKIEINPAEPRYLKVVWGQGYKIERGVM